MTHKELWIQCECGAGGLHIENDEYDDDIYIALWHYGQYTMSIGHKLRWIWQIINGRPFRDQIVIDQSRLQKIIDALQEMKQ